MRVSAAQSRSLAKYPNIFGSIALLCALLRLASASRTRLHPPSHCKSCESRRATARGPVKRRSEASPSLVHPCRINRNAENDFPGSTRRVAARRFTSIDKPYYKHKTCQSSAAASRFDSSFSATSFSRGGRAARAHASSHKAPNPPNSAACAATHGFSRKY